MKVMKKTNTCFDIISHSHATFLAVLAIFFLTTSCRKHGSGYVEGTVIEEYQSMPVPNATVVLWRTFHRNQEYIYGRTTTDENGHFKIKYFKNYFNYDFFVTANSTDCYEHRSTGYIDRRKSNYLLVLPSKAFVNLTVINHHNSKILLSAESGDYTDENFVLSVGHDTIIPNMGVQVNKATRFRCYYNEYPGNTIQKIVDTTFLLTTRHEVVNYTLTIN
jgi:hypothetical protein